MQAKQKTSFAKKALATILTVVEGAWIENLNGEVNI
jgi:hypothetical protein